MFLPSIVFIMEFFLHLILFFVFPFSAAESRAKANLLPHPFYVSVTEVRQDAAAKPLEISCRLFADDFEETLRKTYKIPLDIHAVKDKQVLEKVITDYIGRNLRLVADGSPLTLSYVGYELEKESVWCYFEVVHLPAVKQLDISNTLLYDFRKEQVNIVHVTINGKRHSTKLVYPAGKTAFRF